MQLPPLNDLILPGLTAIFLTFMAWRDARKAKAEVVNPPASSAHSNPIVAGVSMAWDRDQQERFLQYAERIAKAMEATLQETSRVAKAQEALADHQQLELQEKIDELLERMNRVPDPRR